MKLLIVLSILVYDINVSAQEKLDRTSINNDLKKLDPITIEYNGQQGTWFPTDQAEIVLNLLDKLVLSLDIIDQQTIKIEALNKSIFLYKESISFYEQYGNLNKQMIDVSLKYLQEFQQPEYAWYENRVAMYFYGILTGAIIIITSAYVLDLVQ